MVFLDGLQGSSVQQAQPCQAMASRCRLASRRDPGQGLGARPSARMAALHAEWASGQTELTPRQRVAFSPPVPLAPSPVLETASLSSLLPPFTALCLCWLVTPFPADARRRLHSLKLVEQLLNKTQPYIPSFPSPSRSFLDASHQYKDTARSGNAAIALSNPTTRSRRVSAQSEALLLNPT